MAKFGKGLVNFNASKEIKEGTDKKWKNPETVDIQGFQGFFTGGATQI